MRTLSRRVNTKFHTSTTAAAMAISKRESSSEAGRQAKKRMRGSSTPKPVASQPPRTGRAKSFWARVGGGGATSGVAGAAGASSAAGVGEDM